MTLIVYVFCNKIYKSTKRISTIKIYISSKKIRGLLIYYTHVKSIVNSMIREGYEPKTP